MLAERWQRIDQLFERTLELPEAEWSAYLDKQCAADLDLRGEVERLLEQYVRAEKSEFLENPPAPIAEFEAYLPGLPPGQMISYYCVQSELGRGGMGIVYKAHDTRLDRFVALKILYQDRAATHEQKRRLLREARSASALNHPNIVSVYDIGEQDGVCFIAMEYVPGKTLKELVPGDGMPPDQVVNYAAQIADALAAAHQAGIIHRDLKPENIMISNTGAVKVLDFGLAKLTAPIHPHNPDGTVLTQHTIGGLTTVTGAVLGTVNYMSPEQAEGQTVDARSDIFSFGALLYEMLTGRRAFDSESPAAALGAVVHHDPMLAEIEHKMPPELKRITGRCLQKLPQHRFQHMSEIRIALAELSEKFGKRTQRRSWRWFAVVVSILLGLALAVRIPLGNTLWKSTGAVEAASVELERSRDRGLRDFCSGFASYGRWTPVDMGTAVSKFLSAVELFPGGWQGHFGLAKARLAETLLSGRSFNVKREAIMRTAERAVDLGPQIAVTHATLGAALLLLEWNWVEAEREIELGIRWNPQNSGPLERRGQLRVLQGRFEEARRDFARALALQPDFDDCRLTRAWADFCAGDFDLAVARVQDVLPATKKKEQAYRLLAAAHGAKGEFTKAGAALSKAWLPTFDRLNVEAWLSARQGDRQRAGALLEQLKSLCRREELNYCDTALAETALGRYDRAFESLEQGLRLRHWKLLFLSVDPRLKPLHGDPRWADLVTRVRSGS